MLSHHSRHARHTNAVKISSSDHSIVDQVKELLSQHSLSGGRYVLLETAGGVLSPGPSGSLQADLYRPLRLPTLLVGDSKLGGISTTLSAFESLHVRGYDLDSVILFEDQQWGNHAYLQEQFLKHNVPTYAIPMPPAKQDNIKDDEAALSEYYDQASTSPTITALVEVLQQKHFSRVSKLTSLPTQAEAVVWHPFRQHGIASNIIAIDSAYGDHFLAYNQETDAALTPPPQNPVGLTPLAAQPPAKPLLTPLFDASASWWTQGLGHGNPSVALTAAHAAGRYGHVMFAHAIHEPALDISYNLLSTLKNPRLSRTFFTDNGSTGMEVAVKMALRASCARYGWNKDDGKGSVGILGLQGSYHGDTIGVMNCSEPSVFNDKVDWYKPWGHWFEPPNLLMKDGQWELSIPQSMAEEGICSNPQIFSSLDNVFDFSARQEDAQRYQAFIISRLEHLTQKQGARFGALILEPLLMGAGGMIFVDPLFQRTLIKTVREHPHLLGAGVPSGQEPGQDDPLNWSGVPVIADEVFTGLYRLGRPSSSSFLASADDNPASSTASTAYIPHTVAPDISVHAKLLTAGLLPLAITTASESIFSTFLSDSKTDALLHGHSYTAHPIGCMVGDKALNEYQRLDNGGAWDGYKSAWQSSPSSLLSSSSSTSPSPTFSFFSPSLLTKLSHHPRLTGCFALGTVLVLKLSSPGSGYTSTATADVQAQLLTLLDEQGCAVHSRVLGDIIYFMTSLTTSPEQVERLGRVILRALDA